MKREITMKVMLVLVAVFATSGLFAQGTDLPGDGASFAANWNDSTETHMIVGSTVPLYAEPDGYYHPSYNPATENYTLQAGFTWSWVEDGTSELTFSQNNVNDNYVEITSGANPGTYTIYVKEISPWGGGCSSDSTVLDIIVHEAPTASLVNTGTLEFCANDDASLDTVSVNVDIDGGWQNYRLVWNLQISSVNDDATVTTYYDQSESILGSVGYAVEYTQASPNAVGSNASLHDIKTVADFKALSNESTTYTYTLTSINDQAMRFGNFITLNGVSTAPENFTYSPIGQTLEIIVHPTPTTGPIFHINSNWAN